MTPENAVLERHAVYTFRGRWAKEWRSGRVFLAGDAAHLMPPFLGQGLCARLRDARSLSWRLGMVASGLATEAVLDTYGSERAAHVREIIEEAVALGRVICELDPIRAAERDARLIAELTDPNAVTVEPPHPRLGQPSITAPGDEAAGRLSVQARVAVDGVCGLFDDVVGGSWQLIGLDVDPLRDVDDDTKKWFLGIGGTASGISDGDPIRDLDGAITPGSRSTRANVVLSRPDFYVYVYGTGTVDDVPALLGSLREALTGITHPTEAGQRS